MPAVLRVVALLVVNGSAKAACECASAMGEPRGSLGLRVHRRVSTGGWMISLWYGQHHTQKLDATK